MIRDIFKNKWFYLWLTLNIGAAYFAAHSQDNFSRGAIPLMLGMYILNFPIALVAHGGLVFITSFPIVAQVLPKNSMLFYTLYFMIFGFLQWFILMPKIRKKLN